MCLPTTRPSEHLLHERIILPIHRQSHRTLAVINFHSSSLQYYDFFGCAWPAECLAVVTFSSLYTDNSNFSIYFLKSSSLDDPFSIFSNLCYLMIVAVINCLFS